MTLEEDPQLVVATLIHGVVNDMLYQSTFNQPHFPELVELAVVGTGLGVLRSNLVLVKKVSGFWDSTHWHMAPPPFLNVQSLAYANALAAWSRDEAAPDWMNDLNSEVKRPMKRSLKYLFKTGDSFFNPQQGQHRLSSPDDQWWKLMQHSSSVCKDNQLTKIESNLHRASACSANLEKLNKLSKVQPAFKS